MFGNNSTLKQHIKELYNVTNCVIEWMFVSPQNSYVETLEPNVIVFGDGAFGK